MEHWVADADDLRTFCDGLRVLEPFLLGECTLDEDAERLAQLVKRF